MGRVIGLPEVLFVGGFAFWFLVLVVPFWQIFKKYQIPVLNRQKELGYVISYTVYRPGYHTGEDTRWEYRIVIAYKNLASSRYGREVTKQLFPDQATLNREDNRRWELTEAHYDLPIRIIDPNGDGEE